MKKVVDKNILSNVNGGKTSRDKEIDDAFEEYFKAKEAGHWGVATIKRNAIMAKYDEYRSWFAWQAEEKKRQDERDKKVKTSI